MLNSRDINLLRPDVAQACREVTARAKAQGIHIIITSTVRDDECQNQLYQQGRTKSGSIVTNLQYPTFHWSKAGLAFDFCPVDSAGKCLWKDLAKFNAVGKIATDLGLEWGGNWKSFVDMPHIQWSGGGKYTSTMVRALKLPPTWVMPGKTVHVAASPKSKAYTVAFLNLSTEGEAITIRNWVKAHAGYVGDILKCGNVWKLKFQNISTRGECESILLWVKGNAPYKGEILEG